MRIDPRAIRHRPWAPPALAAACLLVLAVFDHTGIGPTTRLNLYVVPGLAAALGVLALAAAWGDRARRAVPDTIGPALLSFLAGLAGIARGDALGSATGTWLYTETGALFALLVVVAWAAPVRRAVPTGVLVVAAATLVPARFAPIADGGGLVAACLLWGVGAVAAAGFGVWLRAQDARRARAVTEVQRAERLELARDLHDFVAHHVSGMVVQAQAAQLVAAQDPARAVAALKGIEEAGTQALVSMRRTVSMLRDAGVGAGAGAGDTDAGTVFGLADLPDLVDRFSRGAEITARLTVAPGIDGREFAPEIGTTIHRVVLEALTNVRRHAPDADAVSVTVTGGGGADAVTITVDSDLGGGVARPATRGGGFGLLGLTERVTAVGGTLTHGPHPAAGWRVEATLPHTSAAAQAGTTRPGGGPRALRS